MTLQDIKKYFFTYRDGLTADVLKRGGVPHKMIFGLQIPQISKLAREISESHNDDRFDLAMKLWEDIDVRESRILACYIWDPAEITVKEAIKLASEVRSQEEADVLAFRILGRLTDKESLQGHLPAQYKWRI